MLLQDSFGQNSTHGQGFDSFTGGQRRPAGSPSSIATRARIIASEEANVATTRQTATKESVMFAVLEFSRNAQRTVCMLMSAVIVAASLSLGAYGAQSMLHETSSLTAVR
jgi:hypothetical protein